MAEFPAESSGAGADPAPELRLGTPDRICSWGMRPHLMTAYLVLALRQHFADRLNLEDPTLRGSHAAPREAFLWSIDNPAGIVIKSITEWDPDVANHRPALVVKRGTWAYSRLGINDEHQGTFPLDGSEHYSYMWLGSHTVFCLANEGAEAERLAAEVYRNLAGFAHAIRKDLKLHRFRVAQVDTLHKIEAASGGGYAVPITVAYAHEDQVVVRPHAPRLKTIALSALVP